MVRSGGIIKSPKQSLIPEIGRLIVFAPFLITVLLLLLLFLFSFSFFSFSFLSADHELVHGRSQELLDRISWNFVEL
jgi:hypothetical protein